MVETNNIERSKLAEFKTQLSPLFQEICQLKSITLIDESLSNSESKHLFSFQDIRAKFDEASYHNVQELKVDMSLLALNVKETFTEGNLLNAASKLDLYIERTIDPIVHANDILALYHTKSRDNVEANLQLNSFNAIKSNQHETFFQEFSPKECMKMLLRWPLPENNVQTWYSDQYFYGEMYYEEGYHEYYYHEEEIKAKNKAIAELTEKTFVVGDSQFKVGGVSFFQMLKYNIHITKSNRIGRSQFFTRYVDKYLKSSALHDIGLENYAIAEAQLGHYVQSDRELNRALHMSLYETISPLVEASLEHHKQHFSKIFDLDLDQTPYFKYLDYRTSFGLKSNLGPYNHGAESKGLNMDFDLGVGYYSCLGRSGDFEVLAPYTGLIKNKYFTFELKSCIEHLQSTKLWNENREYTKEEQVTRNCIKEVEDALYKVTTQCVHLGVTRFLFTNYDGFLLVKLKFEKEDTPLAYGTSLSQPAQYLKCEYHCFSKDETYIRLYILSFFAMNQELIDEITEFRALISRKYEEIRTTTINEQDKTTAKEMGDETVSDLCDESEDPNTGIQELHLCDSDSESLKYIELFEFDETLFERVSYVELGDMITNIELMGDTILQKVKVVSAKFVKSIPPQNLLVKGPLSPKSVLSVVDPFLGVADRDDLEQREDLEIVSYPSKFSYQEGINYTVSLVVIYCMLSEFSGDFIPRLYSYGRLSDLHPAVSDVYLRLSGGYMMTEDLEGKFIENVTEDFFNSKILPLLEKLHSKNIILNLSRHDAIITEQGQFKIINLWQVEFSRNPEKKRRDISRAARLFKKSE